MPTKAKTKKLATLKEIYEGDVAKRLVEIKAEALTSLIVDSLRASVESLEELASFIEDNEGSSLKKHHELLKEISDLQKLEEFWKEHDVEQKK